MSAETLLAACLWLAFAVLGLSFFLTVWRVVKGPTLPDRVVALDMLVGIVIGFIALVAIRTGFTLYIDIAISLGLVGFLATVAFARFILARGRGGETSGGETSGGGEPAALPLGPSAPRGKPAAGRRTGTGPAVRRKARK